MKRIRLAAILIGTAVAVLAPPILAFLQVDLMFAFFSTEGGVSFARVFTVPGAVSLAVTNSIGVFWPVTAIAAFITGWLSRPNSVLNAAVVGVITVACGVGALVAWPNVSPPFWPTARIGLLIFSMLAALIGGSLAGRLGSRVQPNNRIQQNAGS